MKTIWKYSVNYGKNKIKMPRYNFILAGSFREFNNELVFWAVVDTENDLITETFHVYFTGEEIKSWEYLYHVGTAVKNDLVYHLFYELYKEEN